MTQNNVINIQLEESYQEFKLGTELFKVSLGDEMRRKWIEADENYKKKLDKLDKYNLDEPGEMTLNDYDSLMIDVQDALKQAFDILLCDDTAFDKCYAICKDMIRMSTLYNQVSDALVGTIEVQQNEIQKKYKAKMTKKAK
ncbi:phage tail assembly chaperone [Listeria cossartiae]|uniref:phage tail assembly chaperone n=1 Tax=Listeria cossartiae TaxID=2838249 RepID=UPI001E41C4C3|nr:phage tail assembly chaperone [Listeria cossartiae]MCD2223193.1 phage tail assembly chaperone [Listeria cossartiae]MCD2237873.1 phage tail assembly chaperone [Listeria cossartiae]